MLLVPGKESRVHFPVGPFTPVSVRLLSAGLQFIISSNYKYPDRGQHSTQSDTSPHTGLRGTLAGQASLQMITLS